MNPNKINRIKCHTCNDDLTEGELRTHFLKPRLNQSEPTCYGCSQKAWQEVKRKLKDNNDGYGSSKDHQESEGM